MKRDFLLPHSWKKWGWIVTAPSAVLAFCLLWSIDLWPDMYKAFGGFIDEIVMTLLVIGLLIVAFSRERDEDEYTARLRMSSLIWSMTVNYAVLIIVTWCVYDIDYLFVILVNVFMPIVLYVMIFNIAVVCARNAVRKAE